MDRNLVAFEHGAGHLESSYVKNEGKKDASVQRYKGLGEMNAEQLWSTTT